MKKHTLHIYFENEIPEENALGSYSFEGNVSEIHIKLNKEFKDTLIHELTHFCLKMITGKWYGHSKKFKKLYEILKSL